MKKLLAIILSAICLFSCLALPASAAAGGVLGEVATDFFERFFQLEVEEDTPLGYGVIYEIDTFEGVSVVYKPSPSISFENPGIYTITTDTPLSIDHRFIRWEDSRGNPYYAGDKIYVDGMITLYAKWVEKDDNDVRVARIIKTTLEAFKRLVGKFFGVIDIVVNFEPTETVPGLYDLTLNKSLYDNGTPGREMILFYIDSRGIYNSTNLKRIDSAEFDTSALTDGEKARLQQTDAVIYLCTGWDIVTGDPVNYKEYKLPYTFAELKGPNGEDVLIISTVVDGKDIVSEYSETLEAGRTFYMTVTVNDSLYSSFKASTGLEYNESCNPVSAVFTLKK